ncbi:imidazoleglycerol-phosphate dehydratase HisB [Clostridium gasigenes]|uniref:imidazoleglycerol-phosphate dehydratase HisB n=1 Tax=Clostridium gasigenes TaxID=94869 RepID=UPI001C0B5BC0|nr:imidazoleglycerol-phosphate dehydratase HisB [Clostridium gasigenes]MBU3108332.1 imidazoleglycerol-phosphate dehydratase HisB [Clostridium gasigenes]
MNRISKIERITNETSIKIKINLDGEGNNSIDTGVGFFDHMLTLLSFHSGIDIDLDVRGDIEVCDHHLVEDVGIALGKCVNEALGNKIGIKRYGTFYIPMDEALVTVSLDISGRGFLHFEGEFKRESIGSFSTEMVKEFFRAFAFNAGITLHGRVLYGENDHHKIEGLFKALGRALKEAISIGDRADLLPSSKGMI